MDWWMANIKARDAAAFVVPTETSVADKRSLLGLQNIVGDSVERSVFGYTYVEVGSHIGGSIFPHLVDERCREIVSIDPRPQSQPDARGKTFEYKGNSTERMMKTLAFADTSKLRTIENDAWNAVSCGGLVPYFDLAFIDGEHTVTAAVSDFLALLRMAHPRGSIIAFHDANILGDALAIVEKILRDKERRYAVEHLKDSLFAVAFGELMKPLHALAIEDQR